MARAISEVVFFVLFFKMSRERGVFVFSGRGRTGACNVCTRTVGNGCYICALLYMKRQNCVFSTYEGRDLIGWVTRVCLLCASCLRMALPPFFMDRCDWFKFVSVRTDPPSRRQRVGNELECERTDKANSDYENANDNNDDNDNGSSHYVSVYA